MKVVIGDEDRQTGQTGHEIRGTERVGKMENTFIQIGATLWFCR